MDSSNATQTISGWLLDVYPDRDKGFSVWVITDDGARLQFFHNFPVKFYTSGEATLLRELWIYLDNRTEPVTRSRVAKRELYEGKMDVLEVAVEKAAQFSRLFKDCYREFPGLTFYNGDISFPIRYHALNHVFPLGRCSIEIDAQRRIQQIVATEDPWEVHPPTAPLRILSIEPSSDPRKQAPQYLTVTFENQAQQISLSDRRGLLLYISKAIEDYDPDVIATRWGDKWLFPLLFDISKTEKIVFNPNRDKSRPPLRIKENQYFSYGRVVHRDQQTLLFGRYHIDPKNSTSYNDYGIYGIMEVARVSGLSIQNASRRSPGGGFTAMQVSAALKKDILVPVSKSNSEKYKTAAQLLLADNGGMIYQPTVGLFSHVAEVDFFSMYPSIMSKWNISAETVGKGDESDYLVPVLNNPISMDARGLVSELLDPMLKKRKSVKQMLREGTSDPEITKYLQAVSAALKWLGLVSFGYQGFSGNRIGSIEAHEAITAISREKLLTAKEVAEALGFTTFHMYVDSLFVSKPGATEEDHLTPLLEQIERETELTVELEGIFKWIAFLPSKLNSKVPVPNCYFGAFSDGSVKCRGIMLRRQDTPRFLADAQLGGVELMAQSNNGEDLIANLPRLIAYWREQYKEISDGKLGLAKMKIAQMLSRNLDEYKVPSPVARAGGMLSKAGIEVGAGQVIEFLRTRPRPGVLPWLLVEPSNPIDIDTDWYCQQLLRAAFEILQPLGVTKDILERWLKHDSSYFTPADFAANRPTDLPLFSYSN